MKSIFAYLLLLLSATQLFSGHLNAQQTHPVNGPRNIKNTYFAFTNATIFIDANTKIENATLLINEGKVENVGVQIPVPKEAQLIDLKGKFVYPSFIDLYASYGIKTPPSSTGQHTDQYNSNKSGAYVWNDAIRAEVDAVNHFSYDEAASKKWLASGFGATLSGVHDGIYRGSSALVLTHKAAEAELVIVPKAAAGLSFNKGSSRQDYPNSLMGSIALLRQTFYDASWYAKQSQEKNLALQAILNLQSLPHVFEVDNKLSALRAAKIAKEFNKPLYIKGAGDEYQRIAEIKNSGASFIVPINFPKAYEVEDVFDANNVSTADLKHWEMAPQNLQALAKANITFSITAYGCADAHEFLKNLRKAVEYGLEEKAALQALTLTPAKMLKVENQMGALRNNMLANFIISNKSIFDKEAVLLQHWVKGVKSELASVPELDIRGKYKILAAELNNYQMHIEGEISKNTVSLLGTDTLKGSITHDGTLVTCNFESPKKSNKYIRFSFWLSEKTDSANMAYAKEWKGNVQLNNGNSIAFTAAKIAAFAASNKKKDSIAPLSYGMVSYPFTDYGYTNAPSPKTVVFKNATVWSNEAAGILTETDVAISNGKIVGVGKNLSLTNAQIIDAKGKHLTNGIIDEHSHIAIYRGVNECSQGVTAEVRIGDVLNSEDINIYRQLAGGVTAAQLLHGSCNPIGGQSALIKLRWGVAPEKMKIEGADGFIKFALGENVKQSNWGSATARYPQTRMGVEQLMYDEFIKAKEYEKSIKLNPTGTRRDLELETVLEILNKKRFISCHSYVQSEINMLMHLADSMGFKVNTFTHILEGYKVADKMKTHGVHASTFADWWAYKYEVIDAIPYNAAIMHKMGVNVAINSDDAEMGRRLNQEAAKIIKYGSISEEDAWKMVTLNPAKMLHLDQQLGSIKAGKDADLVLWNTNPLSIYAKPEMTFVDGICYYSTTEDELLRKSIQEERQRIIFKMIAAKQAGEKTEKKVSEIDENYHCED